MTTSKQILKDLITGHGRSKVQEWLREIDKEMIPAKATHKRDDDFYKVNNLVWYWDWMDHKWELCDNPADVEGWLEELEELEVTETSNAGLISICPTGRENFFGLTKHEEPICNNETWRGRGKRRKPMCK